jgi:hypothetical protein
LHREIGIQSSVHIRIFVASALCFSGVSVADPKRETPDYDGRGNTDTEAGSWALWIPRIALTPLHVVHEYVLRRPLGAFVTVAERHHWANAISDLFTFGPGGKNMIIPTALFDFGLLPSVGVYFSGDRAFTAGNAIRLHAATWGRDWINLTALDRVTWNRNRTSLAARVEFKRQADRLFLGIGPDVTDATRSRYGLERFDAGATFRQGLEGESSVSLSSGVRTTAYRAGDCCSDPSLDDRIADGSLMAPPGYGVDYTAIYQRAELVLDTRSARPASASGGYLLMHAENVVDTRNERTWIEYGATFGVALDLLDRQRTLKLQLGVDYADPLRGGVVPFDDLASLGGNLMPGFVAGWMVGRSTIAAQLGYTWPVWMWLDGQARLAIGNAFGSHLDDFDTDKLRLSADVGVTSVGKRDQALEILFGVGTETLEQGAEITSVRLTIGSRRGF